MIDDFTSTGAKFFAHQEVMENLRNGRGQPIVTHIMLTDVCNHTCAFCSVQRREGASLDFDEVTGYLDILVKRGLKAVILSGGGNPILYRCRRSGKNFNDAVDAIHERGLEIGLITNGMPMRTYYHNEVLHESWVTVKPATLEKLTWVRISMAGLDHDEHQVYVPDIDQEKVTLGFSYVAHDIYQEPMDPYHRKVSRPEDLVSSPLDRAPEQCFEERMEEITDDITFYAKQYRPAYVRLLPNCLEPELIPARVRQLQKMANRINARIDRDVAFVQYKPPSAPRACYLGYVHPVLNCDGWVYPCDSCVLNEEAGHAFSDPWRVCRWQDVGKLYDEPVRSLIAEPARTCPGCVFPQSNELLRQVVDGEQSIEKPATIPMHPNFV